MIGRVISNKIQKTATVLVVGKMKHPLYQKSFVTSKKYLTDTQIQVKVGDLVEIISIRPISKKKHWKIIKVLSSSIAEIAEQKLKKEAEQVIGEVIPETSKPVRQLGDQQTSSSDKENIKRKGGRQIKVVVDNLADNTKKKSKIHAKSV